MTREEASAILRAQVRVAVSLANPHSRDERTAIVRRCVDEWTRQVAPNGGLIAATSHGPSPETLAALERLSRAGRRVVWVRSDWEEPDPCSVPILYVGREAHANWTRSYPPPWTPHARRSRA